MLLPCTCFVVSSARISNLCAEFAYIDEFADERTRSGIEGYTLTQFNICIKFLSELSVLDAALSFRRLTNSVSQRHNSKR